MKVTFGGMLLDTETRQLHRGEEPVSLPPKAFDLLVFLVENRPNALSKDVLHERLWPGVFVSDTNLAGLVADVRRALGDDARTPRYVRTVQRFGYAFAGAVAAAETAAAKCVPARCWLVRGKRQIPLADGENILGRDDGAGPLASKSVSRRHARITIDGTSAHLEDLGSKNGTFLRGRAIARRERLSDGDTIAFGNVGLVFRTPSGERSTRTWRKPKRL